MSLMQNYTIKVLLPLQNCKPISLWGDSTLWCDWMADQTKLAISQLCFFGCILSHATKTVIPCQWCRKTVCWQNIFITVKTMLVLQMYFSKFQLPCNTFFKMKMYLLFFITQRDSRKYCSSEHNHTFTCIYQLCNFNRVPLTFQFCTSIRTLQLPTCLQSL